MREVFTRSAPRAPQHAAAHSRSTPGAGRLTAARVVCMAHPRRVAKVAKQIEREVGSLLITDKVMQAAVCPERARGFDGALSALASVTEVQISNDLQVAKVYISLYSDDLGKAAAMEGLQRLEPYVRKHVGRAVRLRLTPEIRFVRDDSIERSERIFKLLDQVKKIDSGEAEPPPLAFHGELEEEEWEEEEEEEDDDEDFRTVDLGFFDEEHAAPSPSGGPPAAAPRGQQQRGGGGGGKQQQQQRRGVDEKPAAAEGDEDLEAMLAAFKAQVQQRQGRRR
ncbi:putative ribosome-binding factor chloroplastic [Micractinium conductrix]|uniref:Ribosome-binding factor chloroplastic n=1 Tax=Micractinium conductrix TaxID=554055 RepID=A0A2P6VM32_9CHLO|nr:putative ribosome-binding factor chloroplastic [Micractinium conductrix]|eukprot:PSC75148.1 putative ribosome-binding factor chloroplastic [Micractinium conductrix]